MNREILFRGKRIDNGEWVYGQYAYLLNARTKDGEPIKHMIVDGTPFGQTVDPSTVGQYTGLTDKNGKKIFEGDIISSGYFRYFFVEYSEEDAEYWANFGDSIGSLHTYFSPQSTTVIGNIHDNGRWSYERYRKGHGDAYQVLRL